jgi:hypothetical protein
LRIRLGCTSVRFAQVPHSAVPSSATSVVFEHPQ